MSARQTLSVVVEAWWMAWQRRRPAPGLVHHSDQGNQYRAMLYQTVLARRGVVPSMSRKGNCYDNAPVESFFSSLKNELVYHRQFQNQAEAQVAITDYIERFYNRQRLHQALGIGVRRSLSNRRVVRNSRVCYSGATSHLTLMALFSRRLLIDAACRGLKSAPVRRLRGTNPHRG